MQQLQLYNKHLPFNVLCNIKRACLFCFDSLVVSHFCNPFCVSQFQKQTKQIETNQKLQWAHYIGFAMISRVCIRVGGQIIPEVVYTKPQKKLCTICTVEEIQDSHQTFCLLCHKAIALPELKKSLKIVNVVAIVAEFLFST